MAATVQVVEVATIRELDAAVNYWIIQGFVMTAKSSNMPKDSARMLRKRRRRFNWIAAAILFAFGILPAAFYLVFIANRWDDEVVEIRVRNVPEVEEPDRVAELERLEALHEQGALDDEEFAVQKQRVLGQTALGGPTSTQPEQV